MNDPRNQIEEFLKGMQDCQDGKKHESRGKDYDRGYRAQYEIEQIDAERTSGRGK